MARKPEMQMAALMMGSEGQAKRCASMLPEPAAWP